MNNTITGTITTTRKGLGFISDPAADIKDKGTDIVIDVGFLNGALNGDTVEVRLTGKDAAPKSTRPPRPDAPKVIPQRAGEVIRVIARARETFVGTVDVENGFFFIIPDDKKMYTDIAISPTDAAAAALKKDQKVQVSIDYAGWIDSKKNPVGKIIKVLGAKGDNNVEMESIVLEKGFQVGFPAAVEEEAALIERTEKIIPADEIAKRRDIRQTETFTIDPFDAKDFDDAISFKKLPDVNGAALYEIGVHIADVSHYVREGSALDKEAVKRGCSVYLVDRTIPMLPEVLSNDVCSLNPHEDKLTFSAIFTIDDKAKIHTRWFGRTVMNSTHRFTYETAQAAIDGDAKLVEKYSSNTQPASLAETGMQYGEHLKTMNRIAKILQKEKFAAGAIEFEQEEIKFKLDENGKPIGVYKKERLDTHKLVEEYMLLANREVAKFIFDSIKSNGPRDTGAIYRIHDAPDKEKIADLATFAKALGYSLVVGKDGVVTAREMNKLLKEVEGTPHEGLIATAAVRSMQKAIYSTKNIGHFGLAFDFYTHFTSPIRRYPDLLVHRILAKHINHEPLGDKDIVTFQNIAESSTRREIDASSAERDSKKLKQVEYMSSRVGQVFDGTISGVSDWGVYVEENETRSEGMIKLRDLGTDFYSFNQKTYSIIGERSKQKFTLGDPIKFKVTGADLDRKTLDYVLVK
ncbi:MAG: ribonuclease R [bacterium]